jgi:membrane protein
VFTVLNRNINQAWEGSQERGYIEKRLLAFAIIAMLVLMLFVYILSANAIQLLLTQNPLGVPGAEFFTTLLWDVLNLLIPWLIVFSMLFMLYYWIPNTKVPKKAAVISSIITVILLWVLSKGFAWFVSSGLLNYEVVYGSLSTLIIFLLYIYLSSLVILFGNHLAAGLARP